MNKALYKRLFKTALLSTPIISLYGVTPVFIFNKVPPLFIFYAGLGIMINVLIFWLLNIAILRYTHSEKHWRWYLISYALVIIIHVGFIALKNTLPAPVFIRDNEWPFKNEVFLVYPFLSVLAINTIILIICNSIFTSEKNKNAALEIETLKVTNLEAQKKALIQQLQPHFLFNTLSVLKSLIRENPNDAENYAIKLSEFLRYSIQVHKEELVTVEQELKFTHDYIDLQKVRFEDSLICTMDIPDEVYEQLIPAYALQSLIENAIKHNSFTDKRPLHIRITFSANEIKVWNNKLMSKSADTTGTGLKNLNQRYKIIANKEIIINEEKEEFSVIVPLINKP